MIRQCDVCGAEYDPWTTYDGRPLYSSDMRLRCSRECQKEAGRVAWRIRYHARKCDTYVDEIAVERAARGDRSVSLSRLEMWEAFARLDAHGYSHRRIAAILGVSDRSVLRWRSGVNRPVSRPGRKEARRAS